MRLALPLPLAALLALLPLYAHAQAFTQKGFIEAKGIGYPQTTANDDTQVVGEALLRYEAAAKPAAWLWLNGGIDARADTHDQTEWDGISWSDRSARRPGLAVRRLDATLTRGPLSLQAGKQFVRWGKTDILNPTDRFAPRDYLAVVDSEFLGVTAARFTAGLQADTLDLVAARFTPSRTPLLDQRWAGLAAELENVTLVDEGADYPGRTQLGARWNHVGSGYEFSVSAFSGNNNLPIIEAGTPQLPGGIPVPPAASLAANAVPSGLQVPITRVYPTMWMAGGDAAVPLPAVTLKGEAAFFGTSDSRADQYLALRHPGRAPVRRVDVHRRLLRRGRHHLARPGILRARPRADEGLPRPRVLHDRHQSQRGVRRRRPPEPRRHVAPVRVFTGVGPASPLHRPRHDHRGHP